MPLSNAIFIVSFTGTAGAAALNSQAFSIASFITASHTKGLAASCMAIISELAHKTPFLTLSHLVAPPFTSLYLLLPLRNIFSISS